MQPPMNPYANSYANPYAPPAAGQPYYDTPGTGCWRDGQTLIVQAGADLPPRCVKCNQPAELPIQRRTLYWHTPLIYLTACAGLVVYVILALIVRKKVVVSPGLCAEHRRARSRNISIACLFMLASVGAIAYGFSLDHGELFLILGFPAFAAGVIAAAIVARIVYPTEINEQIAKLRGCGEPFLASFPVLPPNPYR